MSEFKAKQSVWDSQEVEERSVNCLKQILSNSKEIKTHFATNDKTANIDGWIELLKERRIDGNITVQIKTLPEDNYSDPKIPCPTSLFGYAQKCPNELVFLIAVNNKDYVAYWKYINAELIDKNYNKANQDDITLSFE